MYVCTGRTPYLEAYHRILLTHECLEMWFIKVILLGAPRLGKTTFLKRLRGKIKDISSSGRKEEEPSTEALESGHSVVIRNLSSSTAFVTPSDWLFPEDLSEEACIRDLADFSCYLAQDSTRDAIARCMVINQQLSSCIRSSELNLLPGTLRVCTLVPFIIAWSLPCI